MKTCFKCKSSKPLSEFYKHKGMSDGYLNKCKECTKIDSNRHRYENLDRVREYDRSRPNKAERTVKQSEYHKHGKGFEIARESVRRYRNNHPLRYKATNAVSSALRAKRILRPNTCENCKIECKPQGHHDDYLKPLDVRWLCITCHSEFHKQAREILREDGIVTGYMLVK